MHLTAKLWRQEKKKKRKKSIFKEEEINLGAFFRTASNYDSLNENDVFRSAGCF